MRRSRSAGSLAHSETPRTSIKCSSTPPVMTLLYPTSLVERIGMATTLKISHAAMFECGIDFPNSLLAQDPTDHDVDVAACVATPREPPDENEGRTSHPVSEGRRRRRRDS